MTQRERIEIANALVDVWEYIRTVSPMESGLDGFHSDCVLAAAGYVRRGGRDENEYRD
jgi:hypothetical protein